MKSASSSRKSPNNAGIEITVESRCIDRPHTLEQRRAAIIQQSLVPLRGPLAQHLRQRAGRLYRDELNILFIERRLRPSLRKRARDISPLKFIIVEIGSPIHIDGHIRRREQQIAAPVVAVE